MEALLQPQPKLPNVLVEDWQDPLSRLGLDEPLDITVEWENSSLTQCRSDQLRFAIPGYHALTLHTSNGPHRLQWILAPSQCHLPPSLSPLNGINCFLPSLRSNRNWGAGDLTDLIAFTKALLLHAPFDFVALNPLHAIHNRAPYNTSPYLPLSIFTRNLLYLDVESCPEFLRSRAAQDLLTQPRFKAQISALRTADTVSYEKVSRLKTFFLLLLYREFLRGDRSELDQYRRHRGIWLENYCRYAAIDRYLHRRHPDLWHWRQWPAEYQSPQSPAVQQICSKQARYIDFLAFVEMRLDQQLGQTHAAIQAAGCKLGLYQDLALATDRVGADHWAYQELFAPGVRVGSPPDDFNAKGQDWGFPALHPQRHADSGYQYFVESIRCAAQHAGVIRFDHVMRLARLYWIPDGSDASRGAYVRDHFQDLLRILALESSRNHFLVVGEDLGTVPSYFRAALDEFRILSYRLILFERDHGRFRPAPAFPREAIASFTTHDLPTFDGWLQASDLQLRLDCGQLAAHDLPAAQRDRLEAIQHLRHALDLPAHEENPDHFFAGLVKFLAATPSRLRLLNLEELSGEIHQQNLPGTTSESPNWQRRMPFPIEDFFQNPVVSRRLTLWREALRRAGTV